MCKQAWWKAYQDGYTWDLPLAKQCYLYQCWYPYPIQITVNKSHPLPFGQSLRTSWPSHIPPAAVSLSLVYIANVQFQLMKKDHSRIARLTHRIGLLTRVFANHIWFTLPSGRTDTHLCCPHSGTLCAVIWPQAGNPHCNPYPSNPPNDGHHIETHSVNPINKYISWSDSESVCADDDGISR